MSKNVVLISGGMDPLHSGHVNYINEAKKLGDVLVVALNSDGWLARKKGRSFLSFKERKCIVENLKAVDFVIGFNDDDGSAIDAIRMVKQAYPGDHIIFANGGDRTKENIPEMVFDDVEFVFGVGGENKMNSSSWILNKWKENTTERVWGKYKVLSEVNAGAKVKELIVEPGKRLSFQRHFKRNELWFVAQGHGQVYLGNNVLQDLKPLDTITIGVGEWHQLINNSSEPLHIVEIQYGEACVEEDIGRLDK